MSSRRTPRALARLAVKNAVLRPLCGGTDFGVFASNDRRRRPVLKLAAADVRALQQDGVLRMREDGAFVLSEAGAARVKREEAAPEEAFLAQHRALTAPSVIDADGAIRAVRGFDADGPMRRLAALSGASGEPWLTDAELLAAARLRSCAWLRLAMPSLESRRSSVTLFALLAFARGMLRAGFRGGGTLSDDAGSRCVKCGLPVMLIGSSGAPRLDAVGWCDCTPPSAEREVDR